MSTIARQIIPKLSLSTISSYRGNELSALTYRFRGGPIRRIKGGRFGAVPFAKGGRFGVARGGRFGVDKVEFPHRFPHVVPCSLELRRLFTCKPSAPEDRQGLRARRHARIEAHGDPLAGRAPARRDDSALRSNCGWIVPYPADVPHYRRRSHMRGPAPMFINRQPATDAAPPLGRPFFTWHGITFSAGMHLWSEPALRGTDAETWVVMTAPTLFDLVELARRKPVGELKQINEALHATNGITTHQYERNRDVLGKITIILRQLATTQDLGHSPGGNFKKPGP